MPGCASPRARRGPRWPRRSRGRSPRCARAASPCRGSRRSPARRAASADDARRLAALAWLYAGYTELLEGRSADRVTLLAAAREGLARARWLEGAEVLVVDDLELEPDESEFVAALAARFR